MTPLPTLAVGGDYGATVRTYGTFPYNFTATVWWRCTAPREALTAWQTLNGRSCELGLEVAIINRPGQVR